MANVKNLMTEEDLKNLIDRIMSLDTMDSVEPIMEILTKPIV